MKVLALVAATLVSQVLGSVLYASEWENFKETYSKKYVNIAEEIRRKGIFMKNYAKILAHDISVGYSLGVNSFADMSADEFTEAMTGRMDGRSQGGRPAPNFGNEKLPESFDWREKGAVTPIKNQSFPYRCGSCWAFATTGAMEGAFKIKTGRLISFSEQELVDCSTENAGCDGGLSSMAFKYIKENGLESEDDYPYTAKNDKCKLEGPKVVTKLKDYVVVRGSEERLRQSVLRQPVSVAVNATIWQTYTGGIFNHEICSKSANHEVLVVGWGTEDSVPYWIVKNSWGDHWGEKGYIRLIRNKNMCGIANDGVYPVL